MRGRLRNLAVWAVLLVVGPPIWCVIGLLPGRAARWRLVRAGGSVLRVVAGVRLQVRGALPKDGPFVLVANHESFIDAMVLICSVTEPLVFVAGASLERQRIAGPFLRHLGCVFVGGRSDERASAVVARLISEIEAGHSLAMFPEGSLSAVPGLRRFHSGAFVVAAGARVPVVPIALSGSRQIVVPGGRNARSGEVHVAVGEPVVPRGSGRQEVASLRSEVRERIELLLAQVAARGCGSEGARHAR